MTLHVDGNSLVITVKWCLHPLWQEPVRISFTPSTVKKVILAPGLCTETSATMANATTPALGSGKTVYTLLKFSRSCRVWFMLCVRTYSKTEALCWLIAKPTPKQNCPRVRRVAVMNTGLTVSNWKRIHANIL